MRLVITLLIFALGMYTAVWTVQAVTDAKIKTLRQEKLLNSGPKILSEGTEIRQKQLDCLAINIYKEAGYEPFEGKVAVGQVTVNRVLSEDFPSDICGVVYQKDFKRSKTVCQFSWYCDRVHKNRAVNPVAYEESYTVAKMVLLEGFRLDSLDEALYYHADYVNPRWGFKKVAKIGRHIFYTGERVGKGRKYAELNL